MFRILQNITDSYLRDYHLSMQMKNGNCNIKNLLLCIEFCTLVRYWLHVRSARVTGGLTQHQEFPDTMAACTQRHVCKTRVNRAIPIFIRFSSFDVELHLPHQFPSPL